MLRLWRATLNSRNGMIFAVRSEQAIREEVFALILSVPVAILIGFAFAGMGMAGTAYMRSWKDFAGWLLTVHAPCRTFAAANAFVSRQACYRE